MKSMNAARCLTRVITDSERAIEIAQIQGVMSRIQSALCGIPSAERDYIANALLNLAVSRMIEEEGRPHTASVLMRLGDVIATTNAAPRPEHAVDLSSRNS
jgi:hypothetical protein